MPVLLTLIVIVGYGIGPTRLPLVGEETCRARHGIEMAQTGDWLVATQQAVLILDRPPLQYWTYSLIHRWVHPLDPMRLRASMIVVTLLTTLVTWWYARRFVGEAGAFFAGAAYATMGHVLDLGRLVETDGLFTLLLAASLMVWHAGYAAKRRWTWIVAAALATLTKGTQAPVAFFGAVCSLRTCTVASSEIRIPTAIRRTSSSQTPMRPSPFPDTSAAVENRKPDASETHSFLLRLKRRSMAGKGNCCFHQLDELIKIQKAPMMRMTKSHGKKRLRLSNAVDSNAGLEGLMTKGHRRPGALSALLRDVGSNNMPDAGGGLSFVCGNGAGLGTGFSVRLFGPKPEHPDAARAH